MSDDATYRKEPPYRLGVLLGKLERIARAASIAQGASRGRVDRVALRSALAEILDVAEQGIRDEYEQGQYSPIGQYQFKKR